MITRDAIENELPNTPVFFAFHYGCVRFATALICRTSRVLLVHGSEATGIDDKGVAW